MPICSLFLNFGVFVVSQSQTCLSDQRDLMIILKNNLKFSSTLSTKLVQWNETQLPNCCLWKGVYCSKEGRVVGLDLFNESITSGLHNSNLFSLQYLQNLNLSYNKFKSSIPSQFGNLTSLRNLNLSNAGFVGQIPNAISRLTRLVTLDLSTFSFFSDNTLKLEDPNLAKLVQNLLEIKELYLDGVNISASGEEWCQALSSSLSNLSVLSMSNCYLSGPLNSSLQKLRSLSIIRLDNNNFSAAPVPEFFAEFRNLTTLRLSSCELNGTFPEKIFQVLTLQTLDLSNNELLQDSIGNLKMLSRIDLSSCSFHGSIPTSMANLVQLVYLDMSFNNFTGPIPSFSMAKNLTEINLSRNHLTGKIDSLIWKDLLKLVNLDLGNNSLEGNIPDSLFSLPSLQILRLSNNQFSGRLEFHVSSHLLNTLDLSSNNLEGPVPMSVFELRNLKILSLSSNNFSGSFQLNKIQQLRNLSNLDLSYNSLSIEYIETSSSSSFPQISTLKLASCKLKTCPDFLINQSKLTMLDLSNNEIPGKIPNWIQNLTDLLYLNLSYNHLEGPLPNLPSTLTILDLHFNQLQGQLPTLPPSATYLDLSWNNFSSVIPAGIGSSLTVTYFLSLSNNKLSGSIPVSICNAKYLQVLDLHNNSLNGTIPQCFYGMTETLGVLDLRRNKLGGNLSDSFPVNCGLLTLNLNGNLLEGAVPMSLGNCKSLEVLDLGNNKIKDAFPCYLKNISSLHVLILRSNQFYGSIDCGGPNTSWPMLQIIDLASNNFTGQLPRESIFAWKAMMDHAQSRIQYLQFGILQFSQNYYQDMIRVTVKGLDVELVRILTLFTSIDVSCNNLNGTIPEEIGELKSLRLLNFSHNALTGNIPPSLGNLTQLESLDLSSNNLTGEIPVQLADSLTFLSFLKLSFNQLVGPIPQGRQFATFTNDSYEGNRGLCGSPLVTKCPNGTAPPPSATQKSEGTSSTTLIRFDWQFILTGLGFGVGAAVVVAPLTFWEKGRKWHDDSIDKILLVILPMMGLSYAGCYNAKVEAEEDIEDENTEDSEDDNDDDEMEDEEFRGQYCVICSKLDISRKRVIHNPMCACHNSAPLSSSPSTSSSSS
nr:receptor-like protein 12 [Quercus suber]